MTPEALRALYEATDPVRWRNRVADRRALAVAEAVADYGRGGREWAAIALDVSIGQIDQHLTRARALANPSQAARRAAALSLTGENVMPRTQPHTLIVASKADADSERYFLAPEITSASSPIGWDDLHPAAREWAADQIGKSGRSVYVIDGTAGATIPFPTLALLAVLPDPPHVTASSSTDELWAAVVTVLGRRFPTATEIELKPWSGWPLHPEALYDATGRDLTDGWEGDVPDVPYQDLAVALRLLSEQGVRPGRHVLPVGVSKIEH